MERNQESQSANFKKFLVGCFPVLNELTPLLGKPINQFLSDELITKLIEIRKETAFNHFFSAHKTELTVYLVEIIKQASLFSLIDLFEGRIGQNTFPEVPTSAATKEEFFRILMNFKTKIVRGELDNAFLNTLFEKLGSNFFEKTLPQRCEQLNSLRTSLFQTFLLYPTQAKKFIAAVVPVPQQGPLPEDTKNALLVLFQHSLKVYMSRQQINYVNQIREQQQALRARQHVDGPQQPIAINLNRPELRAALRNLFLRPPEEIPQRLQNILQRAAANQPPRIQLQQPSADTQRFEKRVADIQPALDKLEIPNCFVDTIGLDIMREPVLLSTGRTYHKSSIINHFITSYNQRKNPTCPFTGVEICDHLTKPDDISLVSNKLLAAIINTILTLVEKPQFDRNEFTSEKLCELIHAFIRSDITKEMFSDPAVVLAEGPHMGETFERSEIIDKLKNDNPGLSDEDIEKKYNIVTNYAIKELVDFVKEHTPKADSSPSL